MGLTLAEKVWRDHVVVAREGFPDLIYIDLHLVHEVTSPQAFEGLRVAGRAVRRPDAKGQGTEGTVGGGVTIAAHHCHAWLGEAQLWPHYMHDPLLHVAQRVDRDSELRAVLAQRLHLGTRDRVGDRLVNV